MKKSFSAVSIAIIFTTLIMFSTVFSLWHFISDSMAFATGKIKTTNLTISDFELKDFEILDNGSLLTTSVDPQLLLTDYKNFGTMIHMKFTASKYPGEVTVYYTRGDEEYSNSQKIWGKTQNDGTYEFVLPRGVINSIRIDPSSFLSVELDIQSIELNPRRSFASYFAHSGEEILTFFVIGIALSCFAKCIYEGFYSELSYLKTKFVFKKRKK